MSDKNLPFEGFINLMQENWPSAYQTLYPLFPKMRRVIEYMDSFKSRLMMEYGLCGSDFELLTALRRSSRQAPYQLKPTELYDFMLFSSGGLTKVLHRLEDKGFITRFSSEADRRSKMVRLTEEGQRLIETVVSHYQQIHHQILDNFSETEVAQLDHLITKLLANAEAQKGLW